MNNISDKREADGYTPFPELTVANDDPIKQWFRRAGEALRRGDQETILGDLRLLGEIGAELRNLVFEAVLRREAGRVWLLLCHFMELSRQPEVKYIRLCTFHWWRHWFRATSPPRAWISEMTSRIEVAFTPGGVEEERELVLQMIAVVLDDDDEASAISEWKHRLCEADPTAFIEQEDHCTLTNLANEIRGRLSRAVASQDHLLIFEMFYKIERNRHWWRTIWHDPIFNAWWQREVNSPKCEKEQK